MNGLIVGVSVSVPNPGGIPDKQPFLICSVTFSICLSVSHIRDKEGTFLHLSKRLSKLASISASFQYLGRRFIKIVPLSKCEAKLFEIEI